MKRILLLLLLSFLSATAFAQFFKESDKEKRNKIEEAYRKQITINNKIKEAFVYLFPLLPLNDSLLEYKYQYDRKGNSLIMSGNSIQNDMSKYKRLVSTYDSKGIKLSELSYFTTDSLNTWFKTIWTYDDRRYLLSTSSSMKGLSTILKYSYDSKGNIVKIEYSSNGEIIAPSKAEYDDKNRIIKVYTPHVDKTYDTTKYSYKNITTKDGNILITFIYDNRNVPLGQIERNYDLHGNCTKVSEVLSDGKILIGENKFDNKERLIECVDNVWRNLPKDNTMKKFTLKTSTRKVKTYDKDGNLVVVAIYENGLLKETEKYYYKKF